MITEMHERQSRTRYYIIFKANTNQTDEIFRWCRENIQNGAKFTKRRTIYDNYHPRMMTDTRLQSSYEITEGFKIKMTFKDASDRTLFKLRWM